MNYTTMVQNFCSRNNNLPDSDIEKRELDSAEKGKGKKVMLLSHGRGEEFSEFPEQRREQTFQFWKM
jgi:hypothetical protein